MWIAVIIPLVWGHLNKQNALTLFDKNTGKHDIYCLPVISSRPAFVCYRLKTACQKFIDMRVWLS